MKYKISIFLSVIAFVSCKEQNRHFGNSESVKNEIITFKLNPPVNKIYKYLTVTETEMEQEVNDEKMKNSNKLEMAMTYSFQKDSLGNLIAYTKYNQFKLSIKAQDLEKELDASNAATSIDPTEKMFGAFQNAEVKFVIDTLGNVKSVSGTKTISDKMYQLANGNTEALQMLNGSIKQYVGDAFFKQVAEQNFKLFSNRQLKPGDTIMISTPINAGFNFTTTTIYKLATIENNIATIEADADVDMKEQDIIVEGTNVTATIKGKQAGDIKIDVTTGLIQQSKSELKLKGIISVKGNEVPIKLIMTNKILLQ
jgi:hypothetical protein